MREVNADPWSIAGAICSSLASGLAVRDAMRIAADVAGEKSFLAISKEICMEEYIEVLSRRKDPLGKLFSRINTIYRRMHEGRSDIKAAFEELMDDFSDEQRKRIESIGNMATLVGIISALLPFALIYSGIISGIVSEGISPGLMLYSSLISIPVDISAVMILRKDSPYRLDSLHSIIAVIISLFLLSSLILFLPFSPSTSTEIALSSLFLGYLLIKRSERIREKEIFEELDFTEEQCIKVGSGFAPDISLLEALAFELRHTRASSIPSLLISLFKSGAKPDEVHKSMLFIISSARRSWERELSERRSKAFIGLVLAIIISLSFFVVKRSIAMMSERLVAQLEFAELSILLSMSLFGIILGALRTGNALSGMREVSVISAFMLAMKTLGGFV
jgi:hypothetical protein